MNKIKIISLAALVGVTISAANAQDEDDIRLQEHVKIETPAKLTIEEANRIYAEISQQMREGYALNDDPSAKAYQSWAKFSTAPYLSDGHGNRYVANYGNDKSLGYLKLNSDEKMPVGSILAKDSFTVTEDGEAFPGALFLMEKLSEGKNPEMGDWRYVMILPDGSKIGDTIGINPGKMEFCHACHVDAEDTDYVFGVPSAVSNPAFE